MRDNSKVGYHASGEKEGPARHEFETPNSRSVRQATRGPCEDLQGQHYCLRKFFFQAIRPMHKDLKPLIRRATAGKHLVYSLKRFRMDKTKENCFAYEYSGEIRENLAEDVFRQLKRVGIRAGWDPIPPPEPKRRPAKPIDKSPTIGTWNINGIAGKREIVRFLCRRENMGVLALQETRRKVEHYPFRCPDYTSFEVVDEGGTGNRGLALLVRRDLGEAYVLCAFPYMVAVRVKQNSCSSLFLNVYVPSHGEVRTITKRAIAHEVNKLAFRFPNDRIHLLGDLNMKPVTATRFVRSLGLMLNRVTGSKKTRWSRRANSQWSQIDYIAANTLASIGSSTVQRKWDDSDHFPVLAKLKDWGISTPPLNLQSQGVVRRLTDKQRLTIASANQWACLADLDLDIGAQTFVQTCQQVTSQVTSLRKPDQKKKPRLSHETVSKIRQKQNAFRVWQGNRNSVEAHQAYVDAAKTSRIALRENQKENWSRFVEEGSTYASRGDLREAWKWLRVLRSFFEGHRTQATLHDRNGSSEDQEHQWLSHYKQLLEVENGAENENSAMDRLCSKFARLHLEDTVPSPMDADLQRDEIVQAIKSMKRWKAPGDDGITSELLKVSLCDDGEALLDAIHILIRKMWDEGRIPLIWRNSTIINLFKSGDASDPANYRGISLINTMIKLLCLIVNKRIVKYLEANGFFCREQAGFRQREECVAQTFALLECLKRQRALGRTTHVAYVDFKKAYDTVPHNILFEKLEHAGLGAKTIRFLEGLYNNSTGRVRLAPNVYSKQIRIQRGLRQGCPLSPLLFNVFINTLLPACHNKGVDVGLGVERIRGLLFADDVVLLGESEADLQRGLDGLSTWSDANGMQVGIAKCGYMVVGDTNQGSVSIGGVPLPNVTEYKYLGMLLDGELKESTMMKHRIAIANATYQTIRPILRDATIPAYTRVRLVKNIMLPSMMYGCELWPSSIRETTCLQQVVDRCLRDLVHMRPTSRRVAMSVVSSELGVPLVSAWIKSSQWRALQKWPTLNTWAATFLQRTPEKLPRWLTSSKNSWIATLRRNSRSLARVGIQNLQPEDRVSQRMGSLAQTLTAQVLTGRSRKMPTVRRYLQKNLSDSKDYLQQALSWPRGAKAVHILTLTRCGLWTSAYDLFRFGYLSVEASSQCPLCGMMERDSFVQLLHRGENFFTLEDSSKIAGQRKGTTSSWCWLETAGFVSGTCWLRVPSGIVGSEGRPKDELSMLTELDEKNDKSYKTAKKGKSQGTEGKESKARKRQELIQPAL